MRIASFKTLAVALSVATTLAAAAPALAWDDMYHRHHHDGRGWVGPAIGLGVLGLATGAFLAQQQPVYPTYPAYYDAPPPPPAYDGCWQRRPVYDRWGRYLGRQAVNVCE